MKCPALISTKDAVFLVCVDWQIKPNGEINEKDLIEWGKQFCSLEKTFIDIGAHMGTYALSYAKLCKKVIAFEPWKKNYYQLCGGIAASNVSNVIPYNVALGEKEESGVMNIIEEDGGNASLIERKVCINEEKVEIKTLDNYNLNDICFIKIDVEGWELNVLKGGVNTLKNNNLPPILLESWIETPQHIQERQALISFMNGIGYNVFPINNYPYMLLCTKK